MNPYLAFSGMVACGIKGMADGKDADPIFEGNIYEAKSIPQVPKTLREATELFRNSAMAKEAFGEDVSCALCLRFVFIITFISFFPRTCPTRLTHLALSLSPSTRLLNIMPTSSTPRLPSSTSSSPTGSARSTLSRFKQHSFSLSSHHPSWTFPSTNKCSPINRFLSKCPSRFVVGFFRVYYIREERKEDENKKFYRMGNGEQ